MSSSPSENLDFFTVLPFSSYFSDGPIVEHLDFSHAYQQITVSQQVHILIHYFFLRQLPFFFSNINSSSSQLQSENDPTFRSSGTLSPDTPDSGSSFTSGTTLSPTLPPLVPIDPFEDLFLETFKNLGIHQSRRQDIQRRLDLVNDLLRNLSRDLILEREQGIRAIELLTSDALRTVRRRLIPEIERLQNLLLNSN